MEVKNQVFKEQISLQEDIEFKQFIQKSDYLKINDDFVRKYYKMMNINELVKYYHFKDLSLLELVMERLPDTRLVIRNQVLTVDFINRFILNKCYYDPEEDVDIPDVIRYQRLTEEEIKQLKWTE